MSNTYFRNVGLTQLARGQRCQNCGAQDGTVVSAHANWSDFGKGKSIKAHDCFIAWLCLRCHTWLDQGTGFDPTGTYGDARADKRAMWMRAAFLTLLELWQQGLIVVNPRSRRMSNTPYPPPYATPRLPKQEPDLVGVNGKAWRYDFMGFHEARQLTHPNFVTAAYLLYVPTAHPFWHSYVLSEYSLRPDPSTPPPLIYLPGATHELALAALDPGEPVEVDGELFILHPPNFVAQRIHASDELAKAEVEQAVRDILDGRLHPDTDHRQAWIARFGDSMMRRSREPGTV